jgi:hypothetical protein
MGLAGGLIGSLAMNLFARAVAAAREGHEGEGAAPGGDRTGRGVQPPQARGTADQDATVRASSILYRAVTGEDPSHRGQRWLGSAAHYTFGGGAGVAYALASAQTPGLRTCHGMFYGALVWAIADEGIMPALGLSRGPGQLGLGVLAFGLAGHLVYGGALESTLRLSASPSR